MAIGYVVCVEAIAPICLKEAKSHRGSPFHLGKWYERQESANGIQKGKNRLDAVFCAGNFQKILFSINPVSWC